jgi:hypothetical protein
MQGYSIDRYSSNPKFDAPGHLSVHRGVRFSAPRARYPIPPCRLRIIISIKLSRAVASSPTFADDER